MSPIITYLILYNQYLLKQIYQLTLFIAKHIPLKQWVFDDSHSPAYQKFKTDKLPIIKRFEKQDYCFLLEYYLWKYGKVLKPVQQQKNKPRTVPKKLCARVVVRRISISMTTTVAVDSTNAKLVLKPLLLVKG